MERGSWNRLDLTDKDDAYYVSLSTVLVATIQETKDRISLIEDIFCSQLFPNIQSEWKSMQKVFSEAQKAAEDSWKKKETGLLVQLEEVKTENQAQKRKTTKLVEDLENSKKEIHKLQEELRKKSRDVDEAKELQEDSLKTIECQALKITNYEGILKEKENEIKLQSINVKQLKESVNDLQEALDIKIKEVDKGKKVQQQFEQQIKQENSELLIAKQHLKDQHCQIDMLSLKIKELEERVGQLQLVLQDKVSDLERKEESIKQLSYDIEVKNLELVSERNKTHEVLVRYKKLKSQQLYLLTKFGSTPDSESAEEKKEAEVNSVFDADASNPPPPTDLKRRDPIVESNRAHAIKPKDISGRNKHQIEEEWARSGQAFESRTRDIATTSTSKKINSKRASPLAGTKRPASRWRDTRSIQNGDGPDPHDDFLKTPYENIRENLNNVTVEEFHDSPDAVPVEVNLSSSDDEVQKNVRSWSGKQQKQQKQPDVPKGYKYVEPVRKKADRDNLKGVECKQCKKFYDAVLHDGGGNEKTMRCEHHDGVSRHRYKHAPPMTPEGFWNIGFDSEIES